MCESEGERRRSQASHSARLVLLLFQYHTGGGEVLLQYGCLSPFPRDVDGCRRCGRCEMYECTTMSNIMIRDAFAVLFAGMCSSLVPLDDYKGSGQGSLSSWYAR